MLIKLQKSQKLHKIIYNQLKVKKIQKEKDIYLQKKDNKLLMN